MSRTCDLLGTAVQSGNNVSHSNRKTRRRFLPNLQSVSLFSEALKKNVSLRITAATLRTVDHKGGFDAFLLNTSSRKLTETAKRLKKQVAAVAKSEGKEQKAPRKKGPSARSLKKKQAA